MHNFDHPISTTMSERAVTNEVLPGDTSGYDAWQQAHATIQAMTAGWLYLDGDELFEHELDADGNDVEPRPHGAFAKPEWAVVYVRTLLIQSLITRPR